MATFLPAFAVKNSHSILEQMLMFMIMVVYCFVWTSFCGICASRGQHAASGGNTAAE